MGYITRRRLHSGKPKQINVSKGAKALLGEYGFDHAPAEIVGTGKGGNIVKKDVSKWLTENVTASQEEE